MSRRIWAWTIIVVTLAAVVGAGFWVLGTTHGTQWAIRVVLPVLPMKVEVKEVAGSLAGGLGLSEISLHTKEWDLEIGRLSFRWEPLHFLTGGMALKKVIFQGVTLIDKHPEIRRPLDLDWPQPPRVLSWFSGWADSFQIKGFTYRSGGQEWILLNSLTAYVSWFFGDLSLKNVKIETPYAEAEGSLQAAFNHPFFVANFDVATKEAKAGIDKVTFTVNLRAARNQDQMSGLFRIGCGAGAGEKLSVAGKMGVGRHALKFSDLRADEKGRRGRVLGSGEIDFSSIDPRLNLHLDVADVDISRELRIGAAVSGKIGFQSDFQTYSGDFVLRNPGPTWKKVDLTGTFEGTPSEIRFLAIEGKLLGGRMKGTLKAAWNGDVDLSGSVQGREMDPAVITPEWKGWINADINGAFRWPKAKPFEGSIKANLLNSTLQEKALTGMIDARWRGGMLDLARLDLHGNGFDFSASGLLQERFTYQARVNDLSGLVPGSKGRLAASGWARWHDGQVGGFLKGRGSAISAFGMVIGEINMETSVNSDGSDLLQGKIKVRDVVYGPLKIATAEVNVDGKIASHNLDVVLSCPETGIHASFRGGLAGGVWQGAIADISGSDVRFGAYRLSEPAALKVSTNRLTIGSLVLSGSSREKLEVAADLTLHPIGGSIKGKWQELNIARAKGVLLSPQVSGKTWGSFEAEWPDDGSLKMKGAASIVDVVAAGRTKLLIPRAEMKFDWKREGLTASWEGLVDTAGKFEGRFRSEQPARMALPETGQYTAGLSGLDLGMIGPWLPTGTDAKGLVTGQVKGRLLPGRCLEMTGQASVSQGVVAWKGDGGTVSVKAERASLGIDWQNSTLRGSLVVALLNQGNLKADFELPVPAQFPVRFDPQGHLRLSAKGEVSEKGIVTAIFPGLIGESQGQLAFDLTAGGTWQAPDLEGKIRLAKASAYLNPAGIRIHDIGGEAELKGDRVNISSFQAVSGSGTVQGSATVFLGEGKVVRYEGKLRGEKFQALYLPEVQVSANPDLSFEGDMKRFALRGSIVVPDALIRYEGKEGVISPSGDVVIVDAAEKQRRPSQMSVDMLVNVVLGDKVQIEAQGVNARLEGKVLLAAQSFDRITADGQVQAIKGQYKRRGITLDVVRGRVVFSGKAVDLAALDVLAVRKIRDPSRFNDIQAGVTVTGTLRSPLVKLYSEPAMTDADILSYMVLGKQLSAGTDSNQTALLMQAAGTLFAKDQSTSLQSQVMKFVGIDTIDVQASGQPTGSLPAGGQQTATTRIGSGQISSIQPAGAKTTSSSGTSPVSSSIVTVGKYLSPDLYVAFGRALFSNDYLVTTRYSLFRNWEIEGSRRSVETGVDLYYKIEFR